MNGDHHVNSQNHQPTRALAAFAASLDPARLPDDVRQKLGWLLLDYLRICSIGARLPWSGWARGYVDLVGKPGASHVLFSPQGNLQGMEDAALAKLGRSRRVALTVPTFYGVARAIAQSELIGVLPSRFATSLPSRLEIACYRLPPDLQTSYPRRRPPAL